MQRIGNCGGQGGAENEAVLLKDGLEATDDAEDKAVLPKDESEATNDVEDRACATEEVEVLP